MIVCPACHAENPDGTKICVKCATELPKPAEAKKEKAAEGPQKAGLKEMARDLVDALWLLLILVLVLVGFWGEATHWTWHLTETEEAKIIREPAAPGPEAVHPAHHGHAAVRLSPETEHPPVEYGSPETFYKKGKKQYDQRHYQASYSDLRQALEIDPTFAKAYFGLGYLYSRFDMDDAAVRMYEMALRFDPNHAESMNNLGMMYYHAGNYEDALNLFQKALDLDGNNPDYAYNLGSVYLDENQPDQALQAFQKAALLRPNDASIYDDMGVVYEKLGRKQDALDAWQKVLQYSNNPDLIQNAKTHLSFLQAQS
jgi:tetratricopeptide (TPR) repeat protein